MEITFEQQIENLPLRPHIRLDAALEFPAPFFPFSFWWVSPPAICSLIYSLFPLGDFNLHNSRTEIWMPASFFSFWKQNSLRTPPFQGHVSTCSKSGESNKIARKKEREKKKKKWSKLEKGNSQKSLLWFFSAALGPGGSTHTQPLSALHVHMEPPWKDLASSEGSGIPRQSVKS